MTKFSYEWPYGKTAVVIPAIIAGFSGLTYYVSLKWQGKRTRHLSSESLCIPHANYLPIESKMTSCVETLSRNLLENFRQWVDSHRTILKLTWILVPPIYFQTFGKINGITTERLLIWSLISSQLIELQSNNHFVKRSTRQDDDTNAESKIPDTEEPLVEKEPKSNNDSTIEKFLSDATTENLSDVHNPPSLIRIKEKLIEILPKDQNQRVDKSRYLELLVHNVSHSDLVVSLDVETNKNDNGKIISNSLDWEKHCLARPKFSCFQKYSRMILKNVVNQTEQDISKNNKTKSLSNSKENKDSVIYLPRYQRSMNDPRYQIQQFPMTELPAAPAGIQLLNESCCTFNERTFQHDFRVRTKDVDKLEQYIQTKQQKQSTAELNVSNHSGTSNGVNGTSSNTESAGDSFDVSISHVFFPQLATLLPVWNQNIAGKQYSSASTVTRVLILVTGVGSPQNMTHSMAGNSTKYCGQLIKYFLQQIDPELIVVQIHSTTNIFRYDENLIFVEKDLIPTINAYRDALATGSPYPDEKQLYDAINNPSSVSGAVVLKNFTNNDWRKQMSVTLSFADGAPARTTAIQASLRHYKPTYYHFWQLKTFWHEQKIVHDDIEIHSFEAMMETSPAKDTSQIQDKHIQAVVKEMKAFYNEMVQTLAEPPDKHDLYQFWLRKSKKPVLSVLLVQSATMKEPQLFRGTNMEVSMPTGSLCAERNVIGSALSANPHLQRQDLKLIAVLAVPPIEISAAGEIPTETNSFGLHNVASYASIVDLSGDTGSRKPSIGSEYEDHIGKRRVKAYSFGCEHEVTIIPPPKLFLPDGGESTNSVGTVSSYGEKNAVESNSYYQTHKNVNSGTSTPLRRIPLFPGGNTMQIRNSKRALVIHSNKDTNPLRPCGACNEWLKKIEESNPYFRILTFTDANCNGMYCSPCQE